LLDTAKKYVRSSLFYNYPIWTIIMILKHLNHATKSIRKKKFLKSDQQPEPQL